VVIIFTRFKQQLEEPANFSKILFSKVQENRLSFCRGATCERLGEANDAFGQIALNYPSVLPREHRVYVNIKQNRKVKFIARNICHAEKS
jgi:hypothetical protein